jgi:Ca-activated chloride channel family protein
VDTNESGSQFEGSEPSLGEPSRGSGKIGRIARRRTVVGGIALALVASLIAGAYVVGGPKVASSTASVDSGPNGVPVVDRDFGSLPGTGGSDSKGEIAVQPGTDGGTAVTPGDVSPLYQATTLDATQIIKTGSLALEVADIDNSSTRAKAAVSGLGGYVSDSNRSGTGDYTIASITFRLPSAKFDEALSTLRALGSKTISEQTGTQDVTTQVIDLDARIDNLERTEAALQSIMNKATVIADVLNVQNQLTQTQGQIEQLKAQRDHLKNQAAMSTLTVTLQLPSKTVTTQATEEWNLSNQIDQAGAALVRIGQGMATMAVWAVVVILPIGLAILILLAIAKIFRRITRRGKSSDSAVGA